MSIPRFAIERPVTMFMASAVIVLLGAISLFRLPVDLMPDVTYPSITVRVGYNGVGPQEIEQIIVRPVEQAVAAVPGVEQINSTSSEGSGTVRLNFAWGTDLAEAADDVRTRVDRVRGRLPIEADAPTIQKYDANASPIVQIGVQGDYDRVALRETGRERPRAPLRARRGRGRRHGQWRPAPRDPRRTVEGEDHRARPLGRPCGQRHRHGEPEHSARRGGRGRHDLPAAEPGRVPQPGPDPGHRGPHQEWHPGLPARHRRRPGHDRGPALLPAHQREARRADVDLQAVGQEHGGDCRRHPRRDRRAPTSRCRACT